MMKKLLLIVILLSAINLTQAQEEIVKWTFPTGKDADTIQNGTNPLNLSSTLRVEGAGPITWKNGATDFACQTTNWMDGMNVKNWNIRFLTTGYRQVKISSKQSAGGTNGGPIDFKLQYKISSSGTWNDISGGTVMLANNWTSGVITNLDLPEDCQNQSEMVYIRWLMASNTNIGGGSMTTAGLSKIDDIIVSGILSTGINEYEAQVLKSFPNPSISTFSVSMPKETSNLEIYNTIGRLVFKIIPEKEMITVDKSLAPGLYFIKAVSNGKTNLIKHIVR